MSALMEAVKELPLVETIPFEETEDPNVRTHMVNPPKNLHIWRDGMDVREMAEIARITGQELEALCGYRWVPKLNPDKYDVCEKCMAIAGEMMRERGE
jgi:hypothetical protein